MALPTNRAIATGSRDTACNLYNAEVALHIARQSGVDTWITAAYDRLHLAILEDSAADRDERDTSWTTPSPK